MKYKSLRGRAGLIAAAAVFILSGCQSGGSIQSQEGVDLLSQIQQRGVLRIGTEGTYSPNSYHD